MTFFEFIQTGNHLAVLLRNFKDCLRNDIQLLYETLDRPLQDQIVRTHVLVKELCVVEAELMRTLADLLVNSAADAIEVSRELLLADSQSQAGLEVTDHGAMVHHLILKTLKDVFKVFKLEIQPKHVQSCVRSGLHV